MAHITGRATPEQEARLREWVDEDPARAASVQELRAIWEATDSPPTRFDTEAALFRHRIRRHAALPGRAPREAALQPRRLARWGASRVARVAAGVVLFIATAALWELTGRSSEPEGRRAEYDEFSAPPKQGARLRLGDGSHILLGADSRLRVRRGPETGPREVHLQGVASFDVVPDAQRPFLVRTANSVTRVLGTRFVVRAPAGTPRAHVIVAEGRVSLRAERAPEESELVLTGGQVGVVEANDSAAVAGQWSAGHQVSWSQGRVAFEDAALPDVLEVLDVWFGVDIRMADEALATRHLTLTLHDETLEQTLDLIALLVDARYELTDRTAIIRKEPRP